MPSENRKWIPRSVRDFVYARDGGVCVQCGTTEDLQLDHITPLVQGGTDGADNLRLLCGKHNRDRNKELKDSAPVVTRTTWVNPRWVQDRA